MGANNQDFSGITQTNLEISHIETDHSLCREPIRNFECGGRY